MKKTDRMFIMIILISIIASASILIYKVESKPQYDQELYDQIYAEYEEISSNNNQNAEIKNSDTQDKEYYRIGSTGNTYRVLGEISILNINTKYPIIYETTEELLEIAPTKLAGPEMHQTGNFCVIGHNYRDEQFFSRIKELNIYDEIHMTSNIGEEQKYIIYDKYEVYETDLSVLNQETDGKVELTLITCTENEEKRLIIKASMVNNN